MINLFDKLVNLIKSSKFQKNLKKFNFLLTLLSFLIIFETFQNSNFTNLNFFYSNSIFLTGLLLYFANLIIWSRFMSSNYEQFSPSYFINWSRSRLGRYIPSGVLLVTTRLEENLSEGKNSKKILFGLLEEQFLFSIVGIFTVSLYLNFQVFNNPYLNFFTASFVVVLIIKIFYLYLRIEFTSLINFFFNFILIINLNFIFLEMISAELNLEDSYQIAALYFLSTCLGLLFVGVPAGIGIRELIFLNITTNFFDEIYILEVLIATRVIYLLFDILFGLLGNIFYFINKK